MSSGSVCPHVQSRRRQRKTSSVKLGPLRTHAHTCTHTCGDTHKHMHTHNTGTHIKNEIDKCLAKLACCLPSHRAAALKNIFLSYTSDCTSVLAATTSCLMHGCHLAIITHPLLLCILNLDEYRVGSQGLQLYRSSEMGIEMCSGQL